MRPVFVSYAREDSQLALRIAADLKAKQADVWIDQLDIRPGQQWDREVERALRECNELLVILSPHSVESNNVMDEISFALDEGKVVIPVVAADCQIPFRLRRRQYIDLRVEYERGLESLATTIANRGRIPVAVAAPSAPTPATPVTTTATTPSEQYISAPPVERPAPVAEAIATAATPPTTVKPGPKRRPGTALLWMARVLTILGALFSAALLFDLAGSRRWLIAYLLLATISVAQFAAWKWPTQALIATVILVVLAPSASPVSLGMAEIIIFVLCGVPAALLFLRSRIIKST